MTSYSYRFISIAAVLSTALSVNLTAFAQDPGASNMYPTVGSQQNLDVTKPGVLSNGNGSQWTSIQVGKLGSASNPKNPPSNPLGSAMVDVNTSETPVSREGERNFSERRGGRE